MPQKPGRSLFLLGVVCVLSGCGKSQSVTETHGFLSRVQPVSILAYNTFLRPHLVGLWDKKAERLPTIIQAAAAYDIVGLSEVFDDKLRAELRAKLLVSHPYAVEPPTDPYGIREDGGVFLLSRYPIEFSEKWIYQVGFGADALSVKGVLYARIRIGAQPLDIVLTHAQAGGEHANFRLRQFQELARFAARFERADIPQIVLGDLNVVAESEEYESMLGVFGMPWDIYRNLNGDAGFTCNGVDNPLVGNQERERIDYLLCRHCQGKEGWFKSSQVEPFPLKVPAGKALFGSDHYAVSANLEIPQ